MAHFAQLDSENFVTRVLVVENDALEVSSFPESEPFGIEFFQSLFGKNTIWKQTSYTSSFRKNFAGIGYFYNSELDAFVPPQPNPEWLLDPTSLQWIEPAK